MLRIVPAASASNATATRGRLLSHAPVQVDMDDPNIDWGDPLVIEVWARMWKELPLSGGLIGDGTNLSDNSGSIDASSDGLGGAMTEQEKFECAKATLSCLVAVGAYVGGIAALIAACGGTIGLTCIGVLLLHPVLGPYAVLECTDAINKCHLNR